MAEDTSSSASTTKTKAAPKAAESRGEGADIQDIRTEQEDARIAANQERYEARVGGKSSAEVNADEAAAKAKAKDAPEAEKQEHGGQTVRENAGDGVPAV
jgi:hypothetical protein